MTSRRDVPYLRRPHDEVRNRLLEFIEQGEELRGRSLHPRDIDRWEDDLRTWTDGVLEYLRRQFTTDEERQRFGQIQRTAYSIRTPMTPPGLPEWDIQDTRELIRRQVSHLRSLVTRLPDVPLDPNLQQPAPAIHRLPASAFDWIDDPEIRKITVDDYTEAHQDLAAGAYKSAAIIAASAIEAMFLYVLQKPSVRALPGYPAAAAALPPDRRGAIAWDRAQLNHLVDAAAALGFVTDRIARHGHAARDARDTVHALNELRNGRATPGEARILVELSGEFAERLAAQVP